eukprot:1177795-Prorocentrum_minimum.AAC.3
MRAMVERKRKKKPTASWRRKYYYNNRKLAHIQIYESDEIVTLTAIKTLNDEVVTQTTNVAKAVTEQYKYADPYRVSKPDTRERHPRHNLFLGSLDHTQSHGVPKHARK